MRNKSISVPGLVLIEKVPLNRAVIKSSYLSDNDGNNDIDNMESLHDSTSDWMLTPDPGELTTTFNSFYFIWFYFDLFHLSLFISFKFISFFFFKPSVFTLFQCSLSYSYLISAFIVFLLSFNTFLAPVIIPFFIFFVCAFLFYISFIFIPFSLFTLHLSLLIFHFSLFFKK